MIIFLIGFMGCGKSYTGRYLSKKMSIPYMDMDDEIAKQQSKSIAEIFESSGEFFFRELEKEFLIQLNPASEVIISTGGGTPCFNNNMHLMNSIGTTIFLDINKEIIVTRLLRAIWKRPLLNGMNQNDLEFYYDQKMKERRPFYEQANFHFRHQDVDVILALIQSL